MDMTFWLPQAEAALAQVERPCGTMRASWERDLPSSRGDRETMWWGIAAALRACLKSIRQQAV